MPFGLFLAMQAAGMITDYMGTKHASDLANLGMQAQEAGIDANIEITRLRTENASLSDMQRLRKTLGSQIATMAARGTSTSGGNAVSILNESQANFNADERVRRLNQMGRENRLRARQTMSSLQNSSYNSKLWQGFASRSFSKFPSSYAGWKQGATDITNLYRELTNG
jgi:uncharacterized protein YukE